MPEKNRILKITFNGICTLFPGTPPSGGTRRDKVFVLMPANRDKGRKNQWGVAIPPHRAFIYVPVSTLKEPPQPAETVTDEKLGTCNIYFIDHARLSFEKGLQEHVEYYKDPAGHEIKVRPGSDDVASEHDMGWLADLSALLQNPKLKHDPSKQQVGDEVGMIVSLEGGTLKANFPCKTVQPMTFEGLDGSPQGGDRVYPTEFFIEMSYPRNKESATLYVERLNSKQTVEDFDDDKLVLYWGNSDVIEIRIGNDTEDEISALRSRIRCDVRRRRPNGELIPIPRDNDFDLHYDLFDLPPNFPRPVPHISPFQIQPHGCVPLGSGGGQ